MAELAFIPFDGQDDSAKKRKKREAVRVHVMKNFHRQRKRKAAERRIHHMWELSASDECPADSAMVDTTLNEAWMQDEFRMQEEVSVHEELKEMSEPIRCDSTFAVDSLPEYSLASLHADRVLSPTFYTHASIDQNISNAEEWFAMLSAAPESSPLLTDWLPASRAHPFLYHASVFVCSASTETLAQQALSPASQYHRAMAVKMINEKLSDPIHCCSDETIAAIIALANFECIVGNMSNLKYHITGLLELVELRGGLDKLGMSGLLKKLIRIYIWFLEIYSSESSVSPPPMLPQLPLRRCYTSFYHLLSLEPSSTPLPHPVKETPLFSVLKATFSQPLTASPSTAITSRLSALDLSTLPPSLPAHLEYIPRTCQLACLMYHARATCRNAHTNTKTFTLRDYLVQSDMSTLWSPFPGALLWCLVVGAECARGNDVLYAWFAAQLMRCWVPLAMHRWEGLETALEWFGRLVREKRNPEEVVKGA